jgi:hypothetical protein
MYPCDLEGHKFQLSKFSDEEEICYLCGKIRKAVSNKKHLAGNDPAKIIDFLQKVGVEMKSWHVEFVKRYQARNNADHQHETALTRLKDGGKKPEFIIFDDIHETGDS